MRERTICTWDHPRQVFAQDRGTPIGLDMLDDQFRAARMADERALARIVHCVGQIPRHYHVEAEPCHLAGSEGAVEDTDVGVDAHEGDIGNAFLLAEVVDFLPAVADAVITGDIDGRVLALPGIQTSCSRRCRPRPFYVYRVIAAAGYRTFAQLVRVGFGRLNPKGGESPRRTLHSLPLWSSLIEFHRIAGSVDDHHTQASGDTMKF